MLGKRRQFLNLRRLLPLFAGLVLAGAAVVWWAGQRDKQGETQGASKIETHRIGGGELELDPRMILAIRRDETSPATIEKLSLRFSADRVLGLQKPVAAGDILLIVVEPLKGLSSNQKWMESLFVDWRGREEASVGSLYTSSREARKYVRRVYFHDAGHGGNAALHVLQPLELGTLDQEYFFTTGRGDVPLLIDCMNAEMPDSSMIFGFFKACNLNRTYYDKFSYKVVFKRQFLEKWQSIDDFARSVFDASVQNKNWTTGSISDVSWSKYFVEQKDD